MRPQAPPPRYRSSSDASDPGETTGPAATLDIEALELQARLRKKLFDIDAAPIMIGRFTVLQTVGSGAMGVVYAVYDRELDRKVAIKLLHHRQDQVTGGRQRLLREAQALARLSHPNIVHIYEVGTYGERVYLAMEFIQGPTMRQWCADARPRWREVVDVFVQAGRGLAVAHARGIVHRDFKPANMVLGDDGRVRVVDFGLAGRMTDAPVCAMLGVARAQARPSDACLTGTGELLGTPAYMAPEQVSRGATDHLSDQFSFCVSLYESLFRRRPHVGDTAEQVLAAIEQGRLSEPPRRSGVPRRVVAAVMRGLATDPADRHRDIEALLEALTRGRRRWGLGVLAVGGSAAVGTLAWLGAPHDPCAVVEEALVGVWDDTQRSLVKSAFESTDAPFAIQAWTVTSNGVDAYTRSWSVMRREMCEANRVRNEESDLLHDLRLGCLQRRRQRLAAAIALWHKADAEVVSRASSMVSRLPPLESCADVEALRLGIRPPDPEIATEVERIRETIDRAASVSSAGNYVAAVEYARLAMDQGRALEYPPLQAEAALELARAFVGLRRGQTASEALQTAVDWAESSRHDVVAAEAWTLMVDVHGRLLEDLDSALPAFRRAQAAIERAGIGPGHQAELLNYLGGARYVARHFGRAEAAHREALEIHRRMLGPEHVLVAETLRRLANVASGDDRIDEAVALDAKALAIFERQLGPHHPWVGTSLSNLGWSKRLAGDFDGARQDLDRALQIHQTAFGARHALVIETHVAIAELENRRDNHRESLRNAEQAYEVLQTTFAAEPVQLASVLALIGQNLHEMQRYPEAVAAWERYLEVQERRTDLHEAELAAIPLSRAKLAVALREMGRCAEAVRQLHVARDRLNRLLADHPEAVEFLVDVAYELVRCGDFEQGMQAFEDARRAADEEDVELHATISRYEAEALAARPSRRIVGR